MGISLLVDVLAIIRPTPTQILPYNILMMGLIATVGFMYFGISWFRDSNSETLASFTIYMITFCWAMMPFTASQCLRQGEKLYIQVPPPDGEDGLKKAIKRNKWRYLIIGFGGAAFFILLWSSLAAVAPLAAANSKEGKRFLGVFGPSSALPISICTCLPAWVAIFLVFRVHSKDGDVVPLEDQVDV